MRKEEFFNSIDDPEINNIFKNIKEKIEKYLSETDDLVIVYKNEIELDHFEILSKDFLGIIGDKFDSFTMDEKKIKSMFATLKNGIPINEHELKPTEMNEILFVGWIKYFYDVEASTKYEYVQDYQVTMRLLLKSLNSSYIHKKFVGKL
ncbi:hypothetical protein [Marispirochaeta sp.]|uniref:hypothetical protein n=1 Tax=Marispirochaeta sp. TaxID=2038653 RepID=UPI0029C827E2|nr:hypothetical protein [Marispirochaeta sp.]